MKLRNRDARIKGSVTNPHEIRLITFIALGWAALAALALGIFVWVLVPAIGRSLPIVLTSRVGAVEFEVDTAVTSSVSLWLAGSLVALAVLGVAVYRTSTKTAHVLAVIVCFAAPFYTGTVVASAVAAIVSRELHLASLAWAGGLSGAAGLVLGGLSFTFGPAIIDELREGAFFRPRVPRHEA